MDTMFRVRDMMTREVATLRVNDQLSIADDVMRLGRIRHLPVLDDDEGALVGVLSQRDLFRGSLANALGYGEHGQTRILKTILVKEVMANDVATIHEGAPVSEAAKLMVDNKIGCVPVVDDLGALVGILTESDFVRLMVKKD